MNSDNINEFILNDEKKIKEEYEDSFWRLVMHKCVQVKGAILLKEAEEVKNDPRYAISSEADKRIKKSINKHFRKKKLQALTNKSLKAFQKVAVIFFVFAIILTITYTSVEAFRVQVLNMLLKFEDKYVSVKLEEYDDSDIFNMYLNNVYAPTYIPDGYQIASFSNGTSVMGIDYINDEEKSITFMVFNSSGSSNIDTENADLIQSIRINGIEGILVKKNEDITISWVNDNKAFTIYAQISEIEITKIAESIIFIK